MLHSSSSCLNDDHQFWVRKFFLDEARMKTYEASLQPPTIALYYHLRNWCSNYFFASESFFHSCKLMQRKKCDAWVCMNCMSNKIIHKQKSSCCINYANGNRRFYKLCNNKQNSAQQNVAARTIPEQTSKLSFCQKYQIFVLVILKSDWNFNSWNLKFKLIWITQFECELFSLIWIDQSEFVLFSLIWIASVSIWIVQSDLICSVRIWIGQSDLNWIWLSGSELKSDLLSSVFVLAVFYKPKHNFNTYVMLSRYSV